MGNGSLKGFLWLTRECTKVNRLSFVGQVCAHVTRSQPRSGADLLQQLPQ